MAAPVHPVLASSVWLLHLSEQQKQSKEPSLKRFKVSLNFPPIDKILDDGLDFGRIHSITTEPENGAQEIVQALLASHLSSAPDATATIIDSSLSFDVRRLHAALVAASNPIEQDPAASALAALDRLRIMPVFDFIGMTESLAELHDDAAEEPLRHGGERRHSQSLDDDNTNNDDDNDDDNNNYSYKPRSTIADSQDSAEEIHDSTTISPPTTPPPLPPPSQQLKDPTRDVTLAPIAATCADTDSDPMGERRGPRLPPAMLIIDNLSHLAAPLLKNASYAQGQALLTTFLRSLAHVTRARRLCTVVVGAAAGTGAGAGVGYHQRREGDEEGSRTQVRRSRRMKEGMLSQFASCACRPVLGAGIGYWVDMQIYLHAVPRAEDLGMAKEDGRSQNGKPGEGTRGKKVEVVSILEIVQDRDGAREGRWTPFAWNAYGKLLAV